VTKVAGPVGTFGAVSACWRCWERATGQTWTGERHGDVTCGAPGARVRGQYKRSGTGAPRAPRLDEARSPMTRLLALAERGSLPPRARLVGLIGAADANRAGRIRRLAVEARWLDVDGRLTADGAASLAARRAVLAAAGEEVCDVG
jgi:hypothetical protein